MLLTSRLEDPERLQGLFVRCKADTVINAMEAASLFVVEQLVRRSAKARDIYQHRRHTVAVSYCISHCQLPYLTYVPAGTFFGQRLGNLRVNKRVKPAYLADASTAFITEYAYVVLLYIRIACAVQESNIFHNLPCSWVKSSPIPE